MRIILINCCLVLALSGCASDKPRVSAPPLRGGPENAPARPAVRLFISPMGEPFRSAPGEGNPQDRWFQSADTNGDGKLTLLEFIRDADRFFAILDRDHDGEIGPSEITYYENVIAPEIRVGGGGGRARAGQPEGGGGGGSGGGGRGGGGRGGGGGGRGGGGRGGSGGGGQSTDSGGAPQAQEPGIQGAALYSYFDFPEPVMAADTNFNGGVSAKEFDEAAQQRFLALDKDNDGFLTRAKLPKIGAPTVSAARGGRRRPGS